MIWFKPLTLARLNERCYGTMVEFLSITFIEIGENSLTAIMPVHTRIKQPLGIVHGGANVVLAETVASTAANVAVNWETHYCVGLEINANHLRSVREGIITAVASPIHLGRSTQVWEINLFDDQARKTCVSRMTAAVLTR